MKNRKKKSLKTMNSAEMIQGIFGNIGESKIIEPIKMEISRIQNMNLASHV